MGVDINKDNSISISGFDKGIGQSVLSPFSDMLGVNNNVPGVLGVNYKFTRLIETKASKNFVISAGLDYFTLSPVDTTLYRNIAVKLSTTGTLPTGLNTTDVFYLWDVTGDGSTFRFRNKLDGDGSSDYIDLTDAGTGTHSFTVLVPEIIKSYTLDSSLNLYLLDDEQRVWFAQPATNYQTFYLLEGNTSSGTGNGIIYYAGFILVFAASKIDALAEINDVATTPVWSNNFASATSISSYALYPQNGAVPFYSQYDNAIYFGNGLSVSSPKSVYRIGLFEENVGKTFSPTDTSTFSCVADVVEIPYAYNLGYAQSINESGENIIIGTGANTIYYWDRKSILPISVVNMPENNTKSIVVKGSNVYAFNGYNGKFYQVTMTDYGEVFEIPEHLFETFYLVDGSYTGDRVNIEYTDATLLLDEILFSIEVNGKSYLMSYNTKTKSIYKKNISSYGETLTDSGTIGRINKIINLYNTIYNKNNVLISTSKRASSVWYYAIEGYQYGSTAVHKVYDNDEAYVATGLITYGQNYSKLTLKEIQFSLIRALTTGQSIKVYYRRDDYSAWTELQTMTYAVDGAIKDIKKNAPITDIIDLQIKIVINGYNSTSATGTSPRLKLVRLIP